MNRPTLAAVPGASFIHPLPPSFSRETIYGRMWYFTSDFSRGDTAYTKLALDRHTDTTYFQEPCGYVLVAQRGSREKLKATHTCSASFHQSAREG